MLKRSKNYFKHAPSRDARKVYVVCEGVGTEPAYFSFFKGMTSNLEIIPILPTAGTDPLKLKERAIEIFEGDSPKYILDYQKGDMVWFVIDTDTWDDEGKIDPLRSFCQKKNEKVKAEFSELKPYSAWNVAQSNPCFEIWLYYHIYESKPSDYDITRYKRFKDYLNERISGGFDLNRDTVHLERAIDNSNKNFSLDDGKPALFSTEVHLLGEIILDFVKSNLDKLKNKLY